MGLLNALLGNASEVNTEALENEFRNILIEGEVIEQGFKVIRDKWVLTNKRIIISDTQGLTGSKTEYLSIPYKSINLFSVETAGTMDADCELKLWVRSMEPIKKEFGRDVDVYALQRIIAKYVL